MLNKLKEILSSPITMTYYNPTAETKAYCRPHGLGVILTKKQSNINVAEQYISFITNNAVPKPFYWRRLKKPQLNKVITAIQQHHSVPNT